MFDFLKKKLKKSIGDIKKSFKKEEEKGEEVKELKEKIEEKEEIVEEKEEKAEKKVKELKKEKKEAPKEEKKDIEKDIKEKKEKLKDLKKNEKELEKLEESEEKINEEIKKEKKSVFSKLFKKKEKKRKPKFLVEKRLSENEFEKFFKNIEISLLQANVAYEVIQLIKKKLKKELVDNPVKRRKVDKKIKQTIKSVFKEVLLEMDPNEILKKIKKKDEPVKILFLGVNGVGKTTSLAKMCKWLQEKDYSVVFSASDTFRAASIEQLEKHAEKLDVKVIKHKYGADPAAVAYDSIDYAKAHNKDVVLIDSAGRQHSNANLMEELKKIKRVAKPDFTILVVDALTGNDAVEQAKEFGKVGFDAVILGKADVDKKGGAILSVSYVSGKPIVFLGVGQGYEDLKPFDKEKIIKKLM